MTWKRVFIFFTFALHQVQAQITWTKHLAPVLRRSIGKDYFTKISLAYSQLPASFAGRNR